MTVVDFLITLPNCGLLTSVNTETTLCWIFCWAFSSWNCSSWMENVWAGPNSCEEQHVPPQRCKLTTHTSVSVSGSSFFQEVKSVHLKIPQKKSWLQRDNPMTSRNFNTNTNSGKQKYTQKHRDFVGFFLGRPVKAQASLNQQNAFQASKMSRFEVTVSSHATSCFPAVFHQFHAVFTLN